MFSEFVDFVKQMIYLMVFLTLLLQILPNGNYKKYVRFFAGMVFVVTLVSPAVSLLSSDDLEQTLEEKIESELPEYGEGGWGGFDWENSDSDSAGDLTHSNQNENGLNEKDFQNMEEIKESMLQDYARDYVEEK